MSIKMSVLPHFNLKIQEKILGSKDTLLKNKHGNSSTVKHLKTVTGIIKGAWN